MHREAFQQSGHASYATVSGRQHKWQNAIIMPGYAPTVLTGTQKPDMPFAVMSKRQWHIPEALIGQSMAGECMQACIKRPRRYGVDWRTSCLLCATC